jgi:hypothetical protein
MLVDRTDRAVRRARPHLADGEGIVATAGGHEADGRRRQLVILTDRRLLIVARRPELPVELHPDRTQGSFDPTGALLTLVDGEHEVVLRDVDPKVAERLLGLLASRYARTTPASADLSTVRVLA